jgi:hypothetical protein
MVELKTRKLGPTHDRGPETTLHVDTNPSPSQVAGPVLFSSSQQVSVIFLAHFVTEYGLPLRYYCTWPCHVDSSHVPLPRDEV